MKSWERCELRERSTKEMLVTLCGLPLSFEVIPTKNLLLRTLLNTYIYGIHLNR